MPWVCFLQPRNTDVNAQMAEHRDLKLDGRELDPSTTIWRYVKLSTLIYLLKKQRTFIPKLATLQKNDPFEGRLSIYEGHQEAMCLNGELRRAVSWLRRTKADGGTLADLEMKPGRQPRLAQVWMRELTRRRAVWCWHESKDECMGQWRIYGKEAGVAIRSDVESVLRVLSGEGKNRDVAFGRVFYLPANQPSDLRESARDLARNPIFVKNCIYAHEKEVRFVLPDGPWEHPGYPIQTKPCSFVKEVVLSPLFMPSEGFALKEVIESLLKDLVPTGDEPPKVRLSGALDFDAPEGRTEPGLAEVILDDLADKWLANKPWEGSAEENDVPSIVKLFPES